MDKQQSGDNDNKNTNESTNYLSLLKLYLNECFEAFIAILVIRIAVDKGIDLLKVTRASLIIGLLTFILEHYNTDLKSNIKQGITFTAGSQIVNTFM